MKNKAIFIKQATTLLIFLIFTFNLSKSNAQELYPIIENDKYGYINSNGQIVINPIYDEAEDFNMEGTAVVFVDREYFLINKRGERISNKYQLMDFRFQDNGVIETINGGEVSDFLGYNSVSGGKKGYINLKGEVIIENGKYDEIGWGGSLGFKDSKIEQIKLNGKYGLIDNTGKVLIEPIYESIEKNEYSKIAKVKFNNKYGILNFNGDIIVPINYSEIRGSFSKHSGFISAFKDNNTYLINRKGQIVKTYEKKMYIGNFDDGIYRLGDPDIKKMGLIDSLGNPITDFIFDNISSINNGLAMFTDGQTKKYGFIDKSGKIVIKAKYTPEKYKSVTPSDSLIAVKLENKYGFIDYAGNQIIDFKFDKASDFEKGYSVVKYNNKFGLINKNGEFIVEPIYDTLTYDDEKMFCWVINGKDYNKRKTGLYNIVEKKMILEPKYNTIRILSPEQIEASYCIKDTPPYAYRCGLFNNQGKEILPPLYNDIEIVGALIRVKFKYEGGVRDKKISYLKNDGTWVYDK